MALPRGGIDATECVVGLLIALLVSLEHAVANHLDLELLHLDDFDDVAVAQDINIVERQFVAIGVESHRAPSQIAEIGERLVEGRNVVWITILSTYTQSHCVGVEI